MWYRFATRSMPAMWKNRNHICISCPLKVVLMLNKWFYVNKESYLFRWSKFFEQSFFGCECENSNHDTDVDLAYGSPQMASTLIRLVEIVQFQKRITKKLYLSIRNKSSDRGMNSSIDTSVSHKKWEWVDRGKNSRSMWWVVLLSFL